MTLMTLRYLENCKQFIFIFEEHNQQLLFTVKSKDIKMSMENWTRQDKNGRNK